MIIRKPTYEELEQTVTRLMGELESVSQETSQLKRTFLSMISHEMRTPLHAILGFAQLMALSDAGPEEKEEYVYQIRQCSSNLLHLVQNMIDASMLESGDMKVDHRGCNVETMMQELYVEYDAVKHRLEKYSIALLRTIDLPCKGFSIITDPVKLKQVMSLLLENAMKFTQKGIIEYGCYIPSERFIRFFVKDSGIGLTSTDGQKIFDMFTKAGDPDFSECTKGTGMGLGLAIAKGIVHLMGGEIWVKENKFKGTTFTFDVPLVKNGSMDVYPAYSFNEEKKNIA